MAISHVVEKPLSIRNLARKATLIVEGRAIHFCPTACLSQKIGQEWVGEGLVHFKTGFASPQLLCKKRIRKLREDVGYHGLELLIGQKSVESGGQFFGIKRPNRCEFLLIAIGLHAV